MGWVISWSIIISIIGRAFEAWQLFQSTLFFAYLAVIRGQWPMNWSWHGLGTSDFIKVHLFVLWDVDCMVPALTNACKDVELIRQSGTHDTILVFRINHIPGKRKPNEPDRIIPMSVNDFLMSKTRFSSVHFCKLQVNYCLLMVQHFSTHQTFISFMKFEFEDLMQMIWIVTKPKDIWLYFLIAI